MVQATGMMVVKKETILAPEFKFVAEHAKKGASEAGKQLVIVALQSPP